MNRAIADIIRAEIEGCSFVDKIAGLVQTAYVAVKVDETKTVKSFPVACCVTADDCITGMYKDLTPDSSKKSVLYFEDLGVSFVSAQGAMKLYRSRLRLVCWLNTGLLYPDGCKNGICNASTNAIAEIIRAIPIIPFDSSPFVRILPEVVSQMVRSNAIFGNYTYNELQTQYLLAPYDFFALEIETEFAICITGRAEYEGCGTY